MNPKHNPRHPHGAQTSPPMPSGLRAPAPCAQPPAKVLNPRANGRPSPPSRPPQPKVLQPKASAPRPQVNRQPCRNDAPPARKQTPFANASRPKPPDTWRPNALPANARGPLPTGRPPQAAAPPARPTLARPPQPQHARTTPPPSAPARADQPGARHGLIQPKRHPSAPPTFAAAPRRPSAPARAAVIQRMEQVNYYPFDDEKQEKMQSRFAKSWNATQDVKVEVNKTFTVPAKVLIVSEGLERDTGAFYSGAQTLDRTYYEEPKPGGNEVGVQEHRLQSYKERGYHQWDINKTFQHDRKYDLIIARSSICFCFGNDMACGGYHSERQTLDALKQVANLLDVDGNPKARAYLTSGTLVSTAGKKTLPRNVNGEMVPANEDRWDARLDTANFWKTIPAKFEEENSKFVMLPIKMGSVPSGINEIDPPGWLFGFKIKKKKSL